MSRLTRAMIAGIGCGVLIFIAAASVALYFDANMRPSNAPALLFFPYGVLIGWASFLRLGLAVLVNVLQWPLYGLVVALAHSGGPRASTIGKASLAFALVIHCAAILVAL